MRKLRSIPFLDYIILAAAFIAALYLAIGPDFDLGRSEALDEDVQASTPANRTGESDLAATETSSMTDQATVTPIPVMVPVRGKKKLLALDCEARSAVDWAAHYDVFFEEIEFQSRLPKAAFPDDGFVGSPYDDWGHVPPESYGVHAGPVAAVLREYGLKAYAYRDLAWADLQRELDAGHPIIVWVVGQTQDLDGAQTYSAPDGRETVVAPYEHTVILAGYQGDEVIVVDGAQVYGRSRDTFMASWSVLLNMAILANTTGNPEADPL